MKPRLSAVFLAGIMLLGFSGCNDNSVGDLNSVVVQTDGGSILPVKKSVTLTIWAANLGAAVIPNLKDAACYKAFEEATGVKINFIHPPVSQEKEVLNITIASNDLPDMIENINTYYRGGLSKAYADGVIIDMKPLMELYAPNLVALYKEYPDLNAEVETIDGRYYAVPWIKGSNAIRTQNGLIMRKDLLDKLKINVPTNFEEFERTLKAFKDSGVKVPLELSKFDLKRESIAGIFGLEGNTGYILENGKVQYWAYSERFIDYITTLAKWREEGWLDPDFATLTDNIKNARISNGEVAIYYGPAGSGFSRFLGATRIDGFDLVGVPYLNQKFTQVDGFASVGAGATSITTSNKNREIAMAWLDYAFSEAGNLAINFGYEGETYKMIDGYPTYTDFVTKNLTGLPFGDAGRLTARAFGSGPMVQDKRYGDQFWNLSQQQDALATWSKGVAETAKDAHKVYGTLTPEESQSVATKLNEINTLTEQMQIKFINGIEPLSKIKDFQEQLKKFGIEEILALRQKAHDAYVEKFPVVKNPRAVEISDFFIKK